MPERPTWAAGGPARSRARACAADATRPWRRPGLRGGGAVEGVDDGVEQREQHGLDRLSVGRVARHDGDVGLEIEGRAHLRLVTLVEPSARFRPTTNGTCAILRKACRMPAASCSESSRLASTSRT